MSDKSSNFNFQTRARWNTGPWTGGFYLDNAEVLSNEYRNFRTGSEDPDWRRKIALGEDATGPLTAEQTSFIYRAASKIETRLPYDFYNESKGYDFFTGVGMLAKASVYAFSVSDFTGTLGQIDNKALVRLYEAIREKTIQFSGGTFLGEIRDTIQLIRRPAKALWSEMPKYLERLRGVRRISSPYGRVNKLEQLNKIIADLWLEWSFGVQPLLNDIKDATNALSFWQLEALQPRHAVSRGKGYGERKVDASDFTYKLFTRLAVDRYKTSVFRTRIVYRAGLTGHLSDPPQSLARLKKLVGFTWNDFVPTVWELLPWSFVVDYFTNIGDVLKCAATDTSMVKWVNRTVIYERIWTDIARFNLARSRVGMNVDWKLNVYGSPDLGYCTSAFKRVERTRTSLRFPTVEFKMPAVDSAKWINLAALWQASEDTKRLLRRL